MATSRRRFLGNSVAITAAPASTMVIEVTQPATVTLAQTSAPSLPAPEVIALNRMGYGPWPGDIDRVRSMGLTEYVDQQLNPDTIDDSACDQRIKDALLKIEYDADPQGQYPAVDEVRPLNTLNQQLSDLWPLNNYQTPMDYQERLRPFYEVRAATWLRAIYSKRQLQEVLVDFWHNHFNVNAPSDSAISVTFPIYDRDIIRKNCLGNFRAFLEAVAKSTAMMYYLDNVTNKAGGGEGGNENYARELLEQHTLGSENYLEFYNDRRQIGTIEYNGKQYIRGYIDDDVYEAARCFTGWTIANGYWELPQTVPNSGEFYYYANWHDTNPKTVLSVDGYPNIPRSQPDMKDGQDVFDILAGHPGTAQHVCTKLCRRLIADNPPASVVDAAVNEWMNNINAPNQIQKVVRVILLSNEFKTTWGQKIKRPFDALISYLRATGAILLPDDLSDNGNHWQRIIDWNYDNTGHKLFEWPTPTGFPDTTSYWSNTNSLLWQWNLPYIVMQSWGGGIQIDLRGQTNMNDTCTNIADAWIGKLCGFSIDPAVRQELIAFMAQGSDINQPPQPTAKAPDWGNPQALTDRLNSMVQLLATCPDFHAR